MSCQCQQPVICGCPQTTPVPSVLSNLTTPISSLASIMGTLAGSAHTLAPPIYYHVVTADPAVLPAIPAYVVGDIVVSQRFGNMCQWTNRRTGLVIPSTATDRARFTPLEGEGLRTFKTVTVNANTPYAVDCADNGFTSLYILSSVATYLAATSDATGVAATRVTMLANVPFSIGRAPTEPRIPTVYIRPVSANASVQIAYTS